MMSQKSGTARRTGPHRFTHKQGQYLAFIHAYIGLHGQAPAEADIRKYFRVSPPSIHQMILTLERRGLIRRTPFVARSIRVLVPAEQLPGLTGKTDYCAALAAFPVKRVHQFSLRLLTRHGPSQAKR